ncbi:MAG: serine hydrolase domain-containing protein [Pseudomonadota bacterium]
MKFFTFLLLFSTIAHSTSATDISLKNEEITTALITEKVHKFKETHKINGAAAMALGDKTIYAKGFGIADNSTIPAQPCRPDTQFFIGSVTKQFTAAAILHVLYARHENVDGVREALHKPLSDYLPATDPLWMGDMPEWVNRVTLHHLLTHTAGIVSYTEVPSFRENLGNPISVAELISTFKNERAKFEPGAKFKYCNSGYFLLGEVVARLSGIKFSQYLDVHFFKPLSMTSTFLPDEGTGKTMKDSGDYPNLARGYTCGIERDSPLIEISPYWHNSYLRAAGGIVSTVDDLLIWNRSLHSSISLTPGLTEIMLKGYVILDETKPDHFYCYGIGKTMINDKLVFTHDGGLGGFYTTLTYCPCGSISFASFQNIWVPSDIQLKLVKAHEEAEEVNKDLKASHPKEFEEAVTESIKNNIPDEYALHLRIATIHLADTLTQ